MEVKRKEYPDNRHVYRGKEKLTLMGINHKTGQRMYVGFLQIYITKR